MHGCTPFNNLKNLIILMAFLLWMPCIHAAGFNCKNIPALNEAEKLICTTPVLSKLDEKLNSVYIQRLSDTPYKMQLRQEQKVWILQRDYDYSFCAETSEPGIDGEGYCRNRLVEIYQLRIETLSKSLNPTHQCKLDEKNSNGVFSGDWIFEQFKQDKRWRHVLSIIQHGERLTGQWWEGHDGGIIHSGTIEGRGSSYLGVLERCEEFPNKECFSFEANISDQKLNLNRCIGSGPCKKKVVFQLFKTSSKPCAAFL